MFAISKKCFNKIGGFDESVMYSEGKTMIKQASNKGFKYKVVRDPVYTYSYRRFRQNGTLKLISNVAKIEVSSFLGLDKNNNRLSKYYPMLGGSVFVKSKKAKSKFLKNVSKLIKSFQEL